MVVVVSVLVPHQLPLQEEEDPCLERLLHHHLDLEAALDPQRPVRLLAVSLERRHRRAVEGFLGTHHHHRERVSLDRLRRLHHLVVVVYLVQHRVVVEVSLGRRAVAEVSLGMAAAAAAVVDCLERPLPHLSGRSNNNNNHKVRKFQLRRRFKRIKMRRPVKWNRNSTERFKSTKLFTMGQ